MSLFISFEGVEGCGKSTQVRLLGDWLRGEGYRVLATREPGGTRIGDKIRRILLEPAYTEMDARTEILLFSAARAQIVNQALRPHLAAGGIVLCDRFADSTLAYQGYGHRLNLDTLRMITEFATGGLWPDITFYLHLSVEEGLRRKAGGNRAEWNRMERKQLEYHQRVAAGYLELAQAEPARWVILDAQQDIEAIQSMVREKIREKFNMIQGEL